MGGMISEGAEAGIVLVAADSSTAFADNVAAAWIDELGARMVASVADRARTRDDRVARERVQAESGRWLVVRASALGDEPDAQVAVMIEPARAAELARLAADECGLTAREREVTRLVARGLPTAAIASRLYLSPWTVQDHLKAIFEKAGVATRGELVAHLFFQPRVPEL
jgi:DNA-binding CsgD family transcriptional regulator